MHVCVCARAHAVGASMHVYVCVRVRNYTCVCGSMCVLCGHVRESACAVCTHAYGLRASSVVTHTDSY